MKILIFVLLILNLTIQEETQKCTCDETGKSYIGELQKSQDDIIFQSVPEIDPTGDELKTTLSNEDKNIVVVVWFNNLYDHWTQNRLNQEARGTLMSVLKQFHPEVIYREADISTYNRNAYTFEELAIEMGINLDDLVYGPTIVVMHDQRGSAIRSEKGTLSLLTAVDKEIHQKEAQTYGHTTELCNIDHEIEAVNQFKMYNPWKNYTYYEPQKDEINHEKHIQKNVAAKVINMDQYNDKLDSTIK